jgi:hypothetical protein
VRNAGLVCRCMNSHVLGAVRMAQALCALQKLGYSSFSSVHCVASIHGSVRCHAPTSTSVDLSCCHVLRPSLQDSPASAMAIAGIVGGVFAASASHPFDTIKTRMQAAMYSKPEYRTWTLTAATIYKEGGVLNFWRGLLPRMTRIIGEWTRGCCVCGCFWRQRQLAARPYAPMVCSTSCTGCCPG